MKTRSKQPAAKPEKTEKTERPDLMIRAATLTATRAEGDKPAAVRMSVSSEEPVLTYAYYNKTWQRVYEILDHGEGSIDMSRCKEGLVIQDRHYGDQIGLMACEVAERKLGGEVRFCSGTRAQEIMTDAANGLRRNVSVGYTVAPESYRQEGEKNGVPVVRAMFWMPYEGSFEPVPADTTVGVNRAAEPVAVEPPAREGKRHMDPKEMAKLFARAAKYGIEAAKVEALLADGKGRAELDALIVEKQESDSDAQRKEIVTLKERKPELPAQPSKVDPVGDARVGLNDKEVRRYSFINAIRALAGDTSVDVAFERECSRAVEQKIGRSARGFFVPYDVQIASRDLQIAGAGTGSNVVATNLLAGSFIEALRARMALQALGVPVLSGLTGDIAIPKGTTATGYWVDETTAPTESTPVLSQVTGTPKACGTYVDISRKLLKQSSIDIEAFVRNEIAIALAVKIDQAGFNGAGTSEPVGLLTGPISTDVTVTAGTPTYAEMVNMPATVEGNNVMLDNCKWAVTSEVFWKLAATATSTNGPVFIADYNTGRILGKPAVVSSNVTANYGFFGDWTQMILAMWGNGLDLNVDTSSGSTTGLVRIVGFMDVDVLVRQAGAFCHADITT
ncbi:MAG TPA: phage major capsid protein [Candidatus Bathyarchaeia archaeon]|nr:phage major capsid protein [Candidatus Bathyarchaeia archaeon]